MKLKNNTAYELGKRGYKLNKDECLPMNDEVFTKYVEDEDVPLTVAIGSYVQGWHEKKMKEESEVIHAEDRFGGK